MREKGEQWKKFYAGCPRMNQRRRVSTEKPGSTTMARSRAHPECFAALTVIQINQRVYCDGGARGNSRRSGAGAVLLERHSENRSWEIVWWAAIYVCDHSTNNVAEHQALAQGLREAARRYGPSRLKIDMCATACSSPSSSSDRFER
jgi:hypothetical protein